MMDNIRAGRLTVMFVLLTLLVAACGGEEATLTSAPVRATSVPATETSANDSEAEPAPETVEVEAEAVMPDPGALVKHPWQWLSFTSPVEQFDVEAPDRYQVLFDEDGTVQVVAECNNAAGAYTEDAGALTITIGPSTLAACPPDSLTDQFISYLGNATQYFLKDGNLFIDLMADGGTMALAPSDNTDMVAVGEGDLAGGTYLPHYEPVAECFTEILLDPEVFDVECGYATVAEFYDGRSDEEMRLAVVRIKSLSAGEAGPPIFWMDGGPGGSLRISLTNVSKVGEEYRNAAQGMDVETPTLDMLENHDFVLFSQRGTEYSEPVHLTCEEPDILTLVVAGEITWGEAYEVNQEAFQSCLNDYADIDLDAYNNNANADDVNAVRMALGYDSIIFYGESYGAELGQFVMRRHPDILEAVILDGVGGVDNVDWMQGDGLAVEVVTNELLAICAAQDACAEVFGDNVEGLLAAATERLENDPITYAYTSADGDANLEIDITPEIVGRLLEIVLGKGSNAAVPLLIHDLSEGDGSIFGQALLGETILKGGSPPNTGSAIMHLAMVCSDDPVSEAPLYDTSDYSDFVLAIEIEFGHFYRATCPLLDVKPLSTVSDETVTLDVPTLVLGGGLDHRTPLADNEAVANALPNARLVVFPYGSHVQLTFGAVCARSVIAQFVADPSAISDIDTSCATEEPAAPMMFTPADLGLES